MQPSIHFTAKQPKKSDMTVLGQYQEGGKTTPSLNKILKENPQFEGKIGQSLLIASLAEPYKSRLLLIGLGQKNQQSATDFETIAGHAVKAIKSLKVQTVTLDLRGVKGKGKISAAEASAHCAAGLSLASYSFNHYKTKQKPAQGKSKKGAAQTKAMDWTILTDHPAEAQAVFKRLDAAVAGTLLARDLVNEPPNTLYPDSYVKKIERELKPLGVTIEVLDEAKMAKLGFGAMLAVGQGSDHPPRTVIMRWKGDSRKTSKTAKPIAFVGKGVTFDTGGISIKPAAEMDLMKMDMGGSAAVVGAMKSLALRKAKVNAVGIVGLVENMPSGKAYRPGDILTSLSGKTIEVLNTDAEGRLVLADLLTYIQRTEKPQVIIDLATLTGAIMVALGFEYCGAFANQDRLWSALSQAADQAGEKFWRMPLDEAYRKEMESEIADLKNLGSLGRYGGACSAAGFLEHFIEQGTEWAHIDIAGTAWWKSGKPTTPKGGTGFAVRTLDAFAAQYE